MAWPNHANRASPAEPKQCPRCRRTASSTRSAWMSHLVDATDVVGIDPDATANRGCRAVWAWARRSVGQDGLRHVGHRHQARFRARFDSHERDMSASPQYIGVAVYQITLPRGGEVRSRETMGNRLFSAR